MDEALAAVHAAFLQLDRRPAVFDREIREHLGKWHLTDPVPVDEIIALFQRDARFVLNDGKVILPLHEPETADLTGEFLLYYPEYIIPCIVYYDYSSGGLAHISLEEADATYPAYQLRFWHPTVEPPTQPAYLRDIDVDNLESPPTTAQSEDPLPDAGAELIEDLYAMITTQELAEREQARNACKRLPVDQFLANRGGIRDLTPAGVETDDFGQQLCRLRVADDLIEEPVDVTETFGVYPESEVLIQTQSPTPGFPAEAEVVSIDGRILSVALYWDRGPENPDRDAFELDSDHRFIVGELLNPVPFDRKREAVETIQDDDRKRGWLSGDTTVGFETALGSKPSKSRLNTYQYQAAHDALAATDFYCIHGPPGTGKTRTLIEIIRAACQDNLRVLAVAHSNQAVDNLLVGDSTPDRVDTASVHGLVTTEDITAARVGNRSASSLVQDEYVGNDAYQADVVCATMSGAHRFGPNIFDLAVIDEATQASIPASLIPATRAKQLVLAGDHKQLPPYHSGEYNEEETMAVSLFEHLLERYGEQIVTTLRTQYRMNEAIAAFPNRAFYDGSLLHGQQNRTWQISTAPPFEGIHITGEEQQTPSHSYFNEAEAQVVAEEVATLLECGVSPADIGVITPYSGQIGKIRVELQETIGSATEAIKIATVDSFQGSEREAIIVSFVRSNPQGFSGFLTFPIEGPRRLNVALTRARRRCVLIGNFDTLRTRAPTNEPDESSADVYQDLYDYLTERNLLSKQST